MGDVVSDEKQAILGFSSKNFSQKVYADVSRSARLRDICLTQSDYQAKPVLFWQAMSDESELKHAFSGEPGEMNFRPETGVVVGEYNWKAEVRHGRQKALKLKASYLLVYGGLREKDERYVRLYFDKIARFTSYPYFRTLFSMQVGNSNISLNPLPSLTDRVD
ncbi:hypothetical protein GE300_01465 [Rhodobacteraceae bacterium 2CG4]|uniref:Uncharacterized protein n=1 Tax=Halovulum marinum TaxID=2662447 RepID=A0A6L5YVB4_9RHOB|nr:hypothetical protein [Halovulum marinum]MSU88283.1 hypothetical protein [Halovulum marinum]